MGGPEDELTSANWEQGDGPELAVKTLAGFNPTRVNYEMP
jgi:hypothetical protein